MPASFFATLLDQFRNRRDNPVAQATLPWHGRRRRELFWAMFAAVTACSLVGGWVARLHTPAWGHLYAYFIAFTAIPFTTALSVQLFGFRHREGSALSDLALTRLTRREVVFGAVYGSVVASGCLAFPILLGYTLAAAGIADAFPYRLAVLVLLWIAMLGAAVRAWILSFSRFMHVFLYTAAFAVGLFILTALQQIFPRWDWMILAALAVLALSLVRQAGRFAGLRFFAPLDWEALCRAYWFTNELVALFEVDERRAAFRQIHRKNPVRFADILWGWIAGFLVLGAFARFFTLELAQSHLVPRLAYPFLCRFGEPVGIIEASLVSAVVALGLRIRRQHGTLWMPVGSIHLSMLFHLWIPLAPFVSFGIAAGIAAYAGPYVVVSPVRFLAGAGLACFLSGALFLIVARAHSPASVCTFGGLLLLGFLCFFFMGGFTQPVFSELLVSVFLVPAAPAADAFHGLLRWEKTVLVLLGIASVFLLALWPRLCQGIHDRSLKFSPRHTVVPLGGD